MVTHRKITHRDRCANALRRNGSGSFYVQQAIDHAKSVHPRQDRRSTSYIERTYMSQYYEYIQKGYLVKRPGTPLKVKPTEKLKVILNHARAELGPSPSLVEFGNYMRAATGCIKEVPKVVIWQMFLSAHENSQNLQVKYDALEVRYEEVRQENNHVRAGASRAPREATASRFSTAPTNVDAIEEQLIEPSNIMAPSAQLSERTSSIGGDAMEVEMTPSTNVEEPPAPRPPHTPLRVHPTASYPTPPSTISAAMRQHRGAALLSVAEETSDGMDVTEAGTGAGTSGTMVSTNGAGVESIQVSEDGDEFDAIIRATQAARARSLMERLELQRQLQEARSAVVPGQEQNMQRIATLECRVAELETEVAELERRLQAREAELEMLRAQNETLSGERDLYQRTYVVTAAALRGSQVQVTKREEEVVQAKSLFGTIVDMIGVSGWIGRS